MGNWDLTFILRFEYVGPMLNFDTNLLFAYGIESYDLDCGILFSRNRSHLIGSEQEKVNFEVYN